MNKYSIENRQIRVFISSTFRDMQDERDELMKKTFPMLRRKAAERDVTLTELDLRWGITPEESESGKVVEICLREIENSVPFFIGIIGNRYGWIPGPADLGESLRERYSQVNGYVARQLSVTEMEMQFGVLERPEDMHAYFFIKEEETDDVDEPVKLAALKKAVRSNGRYPVSTYSSPEDLANQVEEAFTKLLDELFPEGNLSELEKERIGQRAYLNSLCQNYIRTDANFVAIDEWMEDWEKHQLVITGASGLGKSALMANWVSEKLVAGENLPYKIIYHFVGNGGSLGSHGHVMKALCDEIRDRYGFGAHKKDTKTDEKALEVLVNKVAAEGDKPLLIVLDAINQIIDVDNSKQLNWLPIPPKKVKILFTTLEDDRTMDVFKNRHYPIFTLQPLTKVQREDMVREYLELYSKKLQPHQVERIVSDKQCENTLVLKTLLDELVNFGIFEKLDEKISSYLGTESVEDFYGILLKGYETNFSEPFVKHILSLIAVSRNGLSEEEILSITQETHLHWSQFFCSFRQHLIIKNGLISFAHAYIRKAVKARYLQTREEWDRFCREEIVTLLKDTHSHRAMDEVPYQSDKLGNLDGLHDYLLDLEVFAYLKGKEENILGSYWRKLISANEHSLAEFLPLVENIDDDRKTGILDILSSFTRRTVVDPTLSLVFIEKALPFVTSDLELATVFDGIGLCLIMSANYSKALEYDEKALKIRRSLFGEAHPDVATSFNNVGAVYSKLGDYHKALEYEEKALKIWRTLFGDSHHDVATAFNNVGSSYGDLGDNQKALEFKEKALVIDRSLFGENHPSVALSYNNVGYEYIKLGKYAKALECLEKSLLISRYLYGENHPDVAQSYVNVGVIYGDLGDDNKDQEFQKKALRVYLSLYGEHHPNVAVSYSNVGWTYRKLGDYQKALENAEKALGIFLSLYEENHPFVARSYHNVGLAWGELKDHNKALEYEEKALKIRLSLFGELHPDVVTSFNTVGATYGKLGDSEKELELRKKALDIAIRIGDSNLTATLYSRVGRAYKSAGQIETANDYFRQAAEAFERLGDEAQKQENLNLIEENHD